VVLSQSRWLRSLVAVLFLIVAVVALPAAAQVPANGVLVITPDRGFLGNAEIGDAFQAFAQGRNAELLYVTDARSEAVLDTRLPAAVCLRAGSTLAAGAGLVAGASGAGRDDGLCQALRGLLSGG